MYIMYIAYITYIVYSMYMTITYTVPTFRSKLREALNQAENGDTVIIVRFGKEYKLEALDQSLSTVQGTVNRVKKIIDNPTPPAMPKPPADPVDDWDLDDELEDAAPTGPVCEHGKNPGECPNTLCENNPNVIRYKNEHP